MNIGAKGKPRDVRTSEESEYELKKLPKKQGEKETGVFQREEKPRIVSQIKDSNTQGRESFMAGELKGPLQLPKDFPSFRSSPQGNLMSFEWQEKGFNERLSGPFAPGRGVICGDRDRLQFYPHVKFLKETPQTSQILSSLDYLKGSNSESVKWAVGKYPKNTLMTTWQSFANWFSRAMVGIFKSTSLELAEKIASKLKSECYFIVDIQILENSLREASILKGRTDTKLPNDTKALIAFSLGINDEDADTWLSQIQDEVNGR